MGVLQHTPLSQIDPSALDPATPMKGNRLTDPAALSSIEPAAGTGGPAEMPHFPIPSIDGRIFAPLPDEPQFVSYPIQVKTRSESLDPALHAPQLLPLPTANFNTAPGTEDFTEDSAPLVTAPYPPEKPDTAVSVTSKAIAPPPLPPRRPAVNAVSPAYIARLRRQDGERSIAKQRAATPQMPAVPAEPVMEEILPNDPLARLLIKPDRLKVAELVAKIQKQDLIPDFALKTASIRPPLPMRKPLTTSLGESNLNQHILPFSRGRNEPDSSSLPALEETVVKQLKKNPDLRVQIKAYATSTDEADIGDSRRISLARALSVRSWLLENGIEARRMDIRALGTGETDNSADKVELVLVNPGR